MDHIYIKTPNLECRLFLKMYQQMYMAAGVYLSKAPDHLPPPTPVTHCMNTCTSIQYLFTQGGGGEGIDEPVRRLEGR
jgi:hypothetical protein